MEFPQKRHETVLDRVGLAANVDAMALSQSRRPMLSSYEWLESMEVAGVRPFPASPPWPNSGIPMPQALERSLRSFIAMGSGLPQADVIPGNSKGTAPKDPYATLLLTGLRNASTIPSGAPVTLRKMPRPRPRIAYNTGGPRSVSNSSVTGQ